MPNAPDVTGNPKWADARAALAQLRQLPPGAAEANVEDHLRATLQYLFPALTYPGLATQYDSGAGPIDIYCRNVVFEAKKQGKTRDVRIKLDGSQETPKDQTLRYLTALAQRPDLFADRTIQWKGAVTDGKEWTFYHYTAEPEPELHWVKTLYLQREGDEDPLLEFLYHFVNRTAKMAPPTDNPDWIENQAQPFLRLAAQHQQIPAYQIKNSLWRDLLKGAFLTPPEESVEQRNLFARHTMLVLTARAVAETLLRKSADSPPAAQPLEEKLTAGFAAWLRDAAGAEGQKVLQNLLDEVNRYDWAFAGRDTLKDLYHAVIPKAIRHDFGEYYTPDWLAQAVCEEVMDPEWRRQVLDAAVAKELKTPAVMDPSCGSGTFLYHAVKLLLADAQRHPELKASPLAQAEIVNGLVAGMDLHPVAVELAKATKIAALGQLPDYAGASNSLRIYVGDSLQWESRAPSAKMSFEDEVVIHTDDPERPILLPRQFLLNLRFEDQLNQIFQYAEGNQYPEIEADLTHYLDLNTAADTAAVLELYRRLREYIEQGKNHVWQWYISNLVQPIRLTKNQVSRLVGNPPWVVYNAMAADRQDKFREQALLRGVWAGANLATQNDLAATFVATCVDYYLKPGGKFGFVLPYAALRARHWGPFRAGDWSLPESAGRGRTYADLSPEAWNFFSGAVCPFPWANSSAVFGRKLDTDSNGTKVKPAPLAGIQQVGNTESVRPRMSWEEAKPLLTFAGQKQWPTAPSPAYADTFRQGATLVPQSLVLFDEANAERALGMVRFRTERGKGDWHGLERQGRIEERFAKPALFSKHILPFGVTGRLNIIAPFSEDGSAVLRELPQGEGVQEFNLYWSRANADYIQTKKPKSPATLALVVDHLGKLSARLRQIDQPAVVYLQAGSWLASAVIPAGTAIDSTLYWLSTGRGEELHYLAAVFNARALAEFFHEAGRASDRHFHTGPIKSLPIPAFDAGNEQHANLAAQSQLAHQRVATLVAQYAERKDKINRNKVLADPEIQAIMTHIDQSVQILLPDYCSPPENPA